MPGYDCQNKLVLRWRPEVGNDGAETTSGKSSRSNLRDRILESPATQERNHIFKVWGPIPWSMVLLPFYRKKIGTVGYIITLYSSKSYVKTWGSVHYWGPDPSDPPVVAPMVLPTIDSRKVETTVPDFHSRSVCLRLPGMYCDVSILPCYLSSTVFNPPVSNPRQCNRWGSRDTMHLA